MTPPPFSRCPVHKILHRSALCPCCRPDAVQRGLAPSMRLRGEHWEDADGRPISPPSETPPLTSLTVPS